MKKSIVVGLGVSGQASVDLLLSEGIDVIAVDRRLDELLKESSIRQLQQKGVELCPEEHFSRFDEVDQIIFSSGIRPTHPFYRIAKQQGIATLGEAEFSLRRAKDQPCLAITGTNGKTTVTLLVEHILKESGQCARALGNVGDPLASYFLQSRTSEILVIELSSYQLEMLSSKFFDLALLLNITADHLDVYSSLQEYAHAKCRLQYFLKKNARFYLHAQVERDFRSYLKETTFEAFEYAESIANFLPLQYRDLGVHESENAFAAWLLVKNFGITEKQFFNALETFKKPAHRIEFVDVIDGVSYYDDSKGTNIDAVMRAVESMKGSIVLIVGGVDKGASYAAWKKNDAFQKKVKGIVAFGQSAQKIFSELSLAFKIELASSLEGAVDLARRYAHEGDNILLSPGCASFDMFCDYAHRGDTFKRYVRQLKENKR
jgi:UDP-N-acetylmuramoylalanine--D-glutamate ligase